MDMNCNTGKLGRREWRSHTRECLTRRLQLDDAEVSVGYTRGSMKYQGKHLFTFGLHMPERVSVCKILIITNSVAVTRFAKN